MKEYWRTSVSDRVESQLDVFELTPKRFQFLFIDENRGKTTEADLFGLGFRIAGHWMLINPGWPRRPRSFMQFQLPIDNERSSALQIRWAMRWHNHLRIGIIATFGRRSGRRRANRCQSTDTLETPEFFQTHIFRDFPRPRLEGEFWSGDGPRLNAHFHSLWIQQRLFASVKRCPTTSIHWSYRWYLGPCSR